MVRIPISGPTVATAVSATAIAAFAFAFAALAALAITPLLPSSAGTLGRKPLLRAGRQPLSSSAALSAAIAAPPPPPLPPPRPPPPSPPPLSLLPRRRSRRLRCCTWKSTEYVRLRVCSAVRSAGSVSKKAEGRMVGMRCAHLTVSLLRLAQVARPRTEAGASLGRARSKAPRSLCLP